MADKRKTGRDNVNRQQIVQTARRLFYTKGYAATSLGDLAQESGIPKGHFYYHFRSKDDVLRAVVAARRRDVVERLEVWGASSPSPHTRLHRVVDMLVNEEENLIRYGCPAGSLLTELGKGQRELQEEAFAVVAAIVDFAAQQFSADGVSPKKAREYAVHLIGRCQGAVVMAHGLHCAETLRREVKEIRRWLDDAVSVGAARTPNTKEVAP